MKFFRLKITLALSACTLLAMLVALNSKNDPVTVSELPSLNQAIEDWDQQNLTVFSSIGFAIGKNVKQASLRSIVFVDFQCADCVKNYKMNLEKIKNSVNLGVIYKLYPNDSSCNNSAKNTGNTLSCDLTYLALCAQQSGMKDENILDQMFTTFWELKKQGSEQRKIFESIRVRFNIETAQFSSCQKDPRLKFKLEKMIGEASSNPTFVLPSVYIQNRFYIAGTKTPAVESLYEQLLNTYSHQ